MSAAGAAALRARSHGAAAHVVAVCCFNIAAIIFLQRIVLPLGGVQSVSCLLPIAGISLLYLLCTGAAAFGTHALLSCALFLTAALVSQVVGGTAFSVTSLALLMAIYVLCPVAIRVGWADYIRILAFFQNCMTVVALAAFAQYVTQLAGLGMPLLEHFVPERLIVKDFVYLQEVLWASGLYKPNALVMLEASFLSQFLAFALIVEFWIFRRPKLMLLFGAMLVLTFSGTGMILAAVTLAFMVWKRGLDRMTAILSAGLICVAVALLVSGWLEAITGRVAEFSDPSTSGGLRFVAPFLRVYETLDAGDLNTILWGAGAGFIDLDNEVGVAWNPPTKVWVEYGLVVFVAYWAFLAALARRAPSPAIALALAVEYLFLSGALLQPPIVFACYFLGVGYSVDRPSRATTAVSPSAPPGLRAGGGLGHAPALKQTLPTGVRWHA